MAADFGPQAAPSTRGFTVTDILSEWIRPRPEPAVVTWGDAHAIDLCTSAVTMTEISLGILLPQDQRREPLAAAARQMFAEDFAGRCLAFDASASAHFAAEQKNGQQRLERRVGVGVVDAFAGG